MKDQKQDNTPTNEPTLTEVYGMRGFTRTNYPLIDAEVYWLGVEHNSIRKAVEAVAQHVSFELPDGDESVYGYLDKLERFLAERETSE